MANADAAEPGQLVQMSFLAWELGNFRFPRSCFRRGRHCHAEGPLARRLAVVRIAKFMLQREKV
jgi:hypothetical protein